MNKLLVKSVFAGMVLAFSAGAFADTDDSKLGKAREVKGRNGTEGEIIGEAKAGSAFSKLEIGMPQRQVSDLIGQRDADCGGFVTGKAWIPFHFGGDKYRTECVYKGLGRLEFTSNSDFDSRAVLVKIVNDPTEDGYR
ncbi:hypothetical protein G7069_05465 [Lysobacter sp. HDW10]|uniref:hypothetical protein n=1 Tax=Lysobacter sp. HDW10 TaxID=2714936 RepID=UPI00140A0844|nr:hypothetical protein [Lysobacter sp. HDW10]QIK81091.1 hypothetical protein G7069_05465 [Lysobacter sp. HDW10]